MTHPYGVRILVGGYVRHGVRCVDIVQDEDALDHDIREFVVLEGVPPEKLVPMAKSMAARFGVCVDLNTRYTGVTVNGQLEEMTCVEHR